MIQRDFNEVPLQLWKGYVALEFVEILAQNCPVGKGAYRNACKLLESFLLHGRVTVQESQFLMTHKSIQVYEAQTN